MRTKLTIKFYCTQEAIKLFLSELERIDHTGPHQFKNDLVSVDDEGQPESTKGVVAFVQYKNLPKIFKLVFDTKGACLAGLKTFGAPNEKFEKVEKPPVEVPKYSNALWSDDHVEALTELVEKGLTNAEIGEKLGRSAKAIEKKRRMIRKKISEKGE